LIKLILDPRLRGDDRGMCGDDRGMCGDEILLSFLLFFIPATYPTCPERDEERRFTSRQTVNPNASMFLYISFI
jgi:hypothetical protein